MLYCSAQAAATAPPELSTWKPSPDGEKLETAKVGCVRANVAGTRAYTPVVGHRRNVTSRGSNSPSAGPVRNVRVAITALEAEGDVLRRHPIDSNGAIPGLVNAHSDSCLHRRHPPRNGWEHQR